MVPVIARAQADQKTYGISRYYYHAYCSQYHSSVSRGIAFNFTLLGYMLWWRTQLAAIGPHAKRGLRRGEYMMCRIGDRGAYEVGNVYCGQAADNAADRPPMRHSEALRAWHASHDSWLKGRTGADHPKSRAVRTPEGVYPSISAAAAAAGITRQAGLARVKRGVWQYAT